MTCYTCKMLWLELMKFLEGEDREHMSLERLTEARKIKFKIVENAYRIGQRELESMPSGRSKYKYREGD